MTRFEEKQEEYIVKRDAIVVKANELIQKSRFQLTTHEQKIVLYLISRISPNDIDFNEIELSIQEFCKICGIIDGGKTYTGIKEQVKSLADKSMWITKENGNEALVRWISHAEIDKTGTIKIELDKTLKPYLLQLRKNFTKYSWIYIIGMRSKYSIRLFELLKSIYYDKSKPYEFVFEIEELKKRLGAETYTDYKDFKKRVLVPSIDEINGYTDLNIYAEKLLDKKKVKGIRFHIKNKDEIETIFLREKIDKELGTEQMSIWEIVADEIRKEQKYIVE